jgi:hypothetical protein
MDKITFSKSIKYSIPIAFDKISGRLIMNLVTSGWSLSCDAYMPMRTNPRGLIEILCNQNGNETSRSNK